MLSPVMTAERLRGMRAVWRPRWKKMREAGVAVEEEVAPQVPAEAALRRRENTSIRRWPWWMPVQLDAGGVC